MKTFVFVSAVLLQMGWSYGYPYLAGTHGVGAFAYQDSTGNRYGGTYGLKDGEVYTSKGDNFPIPFGFNAFHNWDDFFPEYFRNFENLLQEAFNTNLQNQKVALNAAKKAYDLTSNHAGYFQNFAFRLPSIGSFEENSRMAQNSAHASSAIGPGFKSQVAYINPANPNMPNVDVFNRFADEGTPHYHSVSSSSYSSSSNVNGMETNKRGAETVVNKDGVITKYRVSN